jgi:serralysin
MVLNMALGGWAGAIDDSALPAEMKIDYVHAYALPSNWQTLF